MRRKLWIILAAVALLAVLWCGCAAAEITTGQCGDEVNWSFDSETGVVTVTGTGPMWDYHYENNPSPFDNNSSVESAVIGEGVTSVGAWFFEDCRYVHDVSLPLTLQRIGNGAFFNNDLFSLTIPDGVTFIGSEAFASNRTLDSVTLPDSVTELGRYTFHDCSSLIDITIPAGVTAIDSTAFYDCIYLKTIRGVPGTYAEAFAEENSYEFVSIVTVTVNGTCGAGVNWVLYSDGTMMISGEGETDDYSDGTQPWSSYMDSLRRVMVKSGVTRIGDSAFDGAGSLLSVSFPDSLEAIGNGAFRGTALKTVSIPKRVTGIGDQAFADCTGLTDASIYQFAAVLGGDAFDGCAATLILHGYEGSTADVYAHANGIEFDAWPCSRSFDCGDNVTCTQDYTTGVVTVTGTGPMWDYDYYIPYSPLAYDESVTSAVIGEGVTSVGQAFFLYCTITDVSLPSTLQRIGEGAFYNTNLGSLTLPDSVTSIGEWSFGYNQSLKSLTLPDSVTELGNYAFSHCAGLTTVILSEGLTEIQSGTFGDCEALTDITIPAGVTAIANDAFENCHNLTTVRGMPGTYAEAFAEENSYEFVSIATVTAEGTCGDSMNWKLYNNGMLWISGERSMDSYSLESPAPWYSSRASITSVSIQNGVTSIGSYAFFDCCNLTGASIPASVETLGSSVFEQCTSLESIVIPEAVNVIPSQAFSGCTSLTDATVSGMTATFGSDVFKNCPAGLVIHGYDRSPADLYAHEMGFTFDAWPSTEIGKCGDNVTYSLDYITWELTISGTGDMWDFIDPEWYYSGREAPWYGCREKIASVVIENGVTRIGDEAFDGCTGLTSAVIPDGVTGIGAYAFCDCTGLTGVMIPDSVTTIGCCAFSDCYGLTGITIPVGVTSIEDGTFQNCIDMTSVTIPSGVTSIGNYAFYSCTDLTGVEIPDGVTTIGNYAFYYCSDMTGITIPGSVTSIGKAAFEYCSGLTGITIPGSVTSIGEIAFDGCNGLTSLTIQDGVTSIGKNAFYGCYGLTSVVIPASVTNIADVAFRFCVNLSSVTILNPDAVIGNSNLHVFQSCSSSLILYGWPGSTAETYANAAAGVTFQAIQQAASCGDDLTWVLAGGTLSIRGTGPMEDYAGYGVTPWVAYRNSITSVVMENGVTGVGKYAFGGLPALENVTIPDGVTDIGDHAFYKCTNLQGIHLPDSVQTVGPYAFDTCTAMKTVHLGSGVTSIGTYTFYDCASVTAFTVNENNTNFSAEDGVLFNKTKATLLYYPNGKTETSYTLPDSVLMISPIAFLNNHMLETVRLNNRLKMIQSFAFEGCSALESIVIPAGVTNINQYCFYECTALTSVTVLSPNMTFGTDIFKGCTALTLYGIAGSTAETYADANGIPFVASPEPTFFLPAALTAIESEAFSGISAVAVHIPGSVTNIDGDPFAGSAVRYIWGIPGTAAQTFADAKEYIFIPVSE